MKICIFTTSFLLLCKATNSNRLHSPVSHRELLEETEGTEGEQEQLDYAIPSPSEFFAPFLENLDELDQGGTAEAEDEVDALLLSQTPALPDFAYSLIPKEFFAPFFQLSPCTQDHDLPDDYTLPYTTPKMCDDYFDENFDSVDDALDQYEPSVVLIVGGSAGIGRANACYWAGRGKTVLSLGLRPTSLIGVNEPTNIECPLAERIINVQYDVAQPDQQRPLSEILNDNNINTIDFLLLNAGRAIVGHMRDWTTQDLTHAYMTNVFGLHEVWRQARDFLNPDRAVVFGLSSVLAENRFLPLTSVYSFTKKAIYDLMLAYAQEEELVQPNTHYAAIVEGSAGSSVGLSSITPTNTKCDLMYSLVGFISNTMFQVEGLDINSLARLYHKGYARIAAAADLNPDAREDIPQSFRFQQEGTMWSGDYLYYNNRMYRPEETSTCHAKYWDQATEYIKNGCRNEIGIPLCPAMEAILIPSVDPRVALPFECGAN